MPTTANYALRYPASTDNVQLWTHFQNLATDVDTQLKSVAQGRTSFLNKTGTSSLTPTASLTDIPGLSQSVTVAGANAYVAVMGTAFVNISAATGGNMVASLVVDGVAQTGEIIIPSNNAGGFISGSLTWKVALTAGSHTLKLQARTDAASAATRTFDGARSTLGIWVFDFS